MLKFQARALSLFLWVVLWGQVSFASTEQAYQSIREVGAPFMVVVEDDEGSSKRAPGVYTRSGTDNEWALAMPGRVLIDKLRGSVVDQLLLTRRTGRYESLFVVDGRLVLMHANSHHKKPGSFAVFGQGDWAIYDPVSQREIELPLIEDTQDVDHFLGTLDHHLHLGDHGQVLIVSVRDKKGLIGSGWTYAVIIKGNQGRQVQAFTRRPILLDYRFRTRNILSSMYDYTHLDFQKEWGYPSAEHGEPWVYSENITKYALRPSVDDSFVLKKWKLERYEKLIKRNGRRPAGDEFFIRENENKTAPAIYYSLLDDKLVTTGQVEQVQQIDKKNLLWARQMTDLESGKSFFQLAYGRRTSPMTSITNPFKAGYAYKPNTSALGGYNMGQASIEGTVTTPQQLVGLEGKLSLNPAGQLWLLDAAHASVANAYGVVLIFVLNNTVYLYSEDVDVLKPLEVWRFEPEAQILKLSAVFSRHGVLVLSYVEADKNGENLRTSTRLFHVVARKPKEHRDSYIPHSIELQNSFFYEQKELHARLKPIVVTKNDEARQMNLFDVLPPSPYVSKKTNVYLPHIHLNDSYSGVVWHVPRAKKEKKINSFLEYKEFDEKPLPKGGIFSDKDVTRPASGLYEEHSGKSANQGPPGGRYGGPWQSFFSDVRLIPRPHHKPGSSRDFIWYETNLRFGPDKKDVYHMQVVMLEKMPLEIALLEKQHANGEQRKTDGVTNKYPTQADPQSAAVNLKNKSKAKKKEDEKKHGLFVALLTPHDEEGSEARPSMIPLFFSQGTRASRRFNPRDIEYIKTFVSKHELTYGRTLKMTVAVSLLESDERIKNNEPPLVFTTLGVTHLPGEELTPHLYAQRVIFAGEQVEVTSKKNILEPEFYSHLYKGSDGNMYFKNPSYASAVDLSELDNLIGGGRVTIEGAKGLRLTPFFEGDSISDSSEDVKLWPQKRAARWLMDPLVVRTSLGDGEKSQEDFVARLFPELGDFLDQVVAAEKNANYILLVPEVVKPVVKKIVTSLWAQAHSETLWSAANKELHLFSLPDTQSSKKGESSNISGQAGFRIYMEGIRQWPSLKGGKAVFYADAKTLLDLGELEHERNATLNATGYKRVVLTSPAPKNLSIDSIDSIGFGINDQSIELKDYLPSSLYWVATAGQAVTLDNLKQWVQKEPEASKIILATEDEWRKLIDASRPANTYGLKNFFIERSIKQPDKGAQAQWVKSLFYAPQVQRMKLRFSAAGLHHQHGRLSDSEALDQLVYYAVNKTHALSRAEKSDHFKKISEVVVALKSYLFTDENLRETGLVDVRLVDKALSRVFHVTLKLDSLPENDILRQLSSRQFLHRVQEEGGYYSGARTVRKLVKVILSQLNKESPRSVPASFILYGESGTGKTALVRAIIKTLGLEYHAHFAMSGVGNKLSSEKQGDVFFVDGSKINSAEEAERLIADLSFFIAHNHRGFIFFDDVHVMPQVPRGAVLRFLRGVVDTADGYFTLNERLLEGRDKGEREDSKGAQARLLNLSLKRVPVNNLIVGMSLNFTDNEKVISEYASKGKEATDEQKIIATLNGEKGNLEASFLRRFSEHIGLGLFPSDAKSLALSNNLQKHARESFEGGRFFVVSPHVVDLVSHRFKRLDARGFLSSVSSSIVGQTDRVSSQSALEVVVPSHKREDGLFERLSVDSTTTATMDTVDRFMNDHVTSTGVNTSLEGRLYFLDVLVQSFRQAVLAHFWSALLQAHYFDDPATGSYLTRSRQALLDYMDQYPYLSLSDLNLRATLVWPYDNSVSLGSIKKRIRDLGVFQKTLPRVFSQSLNDHNYRRLADPNYVPLESERTRRHVNVEYSNRLQKIMRDFLKERLRVDHLNDLQDENKTGDQWFLDLTQRQNHRVGSQTGEAMVKTFFEYMRDMSDPYLEETYAAYNYYPMQFYDTMRMYTYVIDKALSKMPWGGVLKFAVDNLEKIIESVSHGNDADLQFYLFEDRQSIFRTTTPETFVQLLKSWEESEKVDSKRLQKEKAQFEEGCLYMLAEEKKKIRDQ